MHNIVHIDEKWFDMLKETETYYLTPSEARPHRTTQSKRFIGRVMFLCAVARPRYDYRKKAFFDGKIGMWPFVEKIKAQRSSKNRKAGTIEIKPLNVTREVYSEYLLEKVFPAIRSKFPFQRHSPVYIQQDNARPHISPHDPQLLHESSRGHQPIRILCQPPNSPDLNVLDLGIFNSLQSESNRYRSFNIETLISRVEETFDNYPSSKIIDVFITLQTVMQCIIEKNGCNNFKIKRGGKKGLSTNEKMDFNMSCTGELYSQARKFLNQS